MGILTLVRFLFGDRQAILQLASNRATARLGILLVLSAGFAREYDGEDLWREPWHLVLPLGASALASFVLFCMAVLGTSRKDGPWFSAYRSFLGLFWMTAPLAWIYAIPYERFMNPVDALKANLVSLGVVATWRVLLMTRVLVVLCNFTAFQAFCRVMVVADALALTAVYFVPVPLLDLMAGIRLSESDRHLRGIATNILLLGMCSAPFWLFGASVAWSTSEAGKWQTSMLATESAKPTWPLQILVWTAVGIWAAILPFTQPEQQLRHQVELDFKESRIASALAMMSQHRLEEFPPHWQPPPRYVTRFGFYSSPRLLDVVEEMQKMPTAAWVREIYVGKLQDQLLSTYFLDSDELRMLASALAQLPEGDDILKELEQNEIARERYLQTLKALVNETRKKK